MLEFARAQWLWLFALSVVLYAAYLLARRYARARVTYGQVWQAVARRVRPPGWKRLLRAALTLALAGLILGGVVLYVAGLGRPPAERPAPLLVAIAVDATPSMAARHGATTRRALANARALEILAALGPDDRAVIYQFESGRPVGTPWLRAGDRPQLHEDIDFAAPDLSALAAAVAAWQVPPGLPDRPAPQTVLWWLGDDAPGLARRDPPARLAAAGGDWFALGGLPVLVETFGAAAENDGITAVGVVPTAAGPRLEAATRRGGPVLLQPPPSRAGAAARAQGPALEFDLPRDHGSGSGVLALAKGDALALDDRVEFRLRNDALASLALWHPAEDGRDNPFLSEALGVLLPGAETRRDDADLVVMDRVAPRVPDCRAALCFGAIPAAWGRVGAPVSVKPGFQRAQTPADFELPDLSLLSAQQAWPLEDSPLRPLLSDPLGRVLIADGEIGGTRVLYCGFVPHLSTLLDQRGDLGGLLLLVRWLAAVQAPRDWGIPPFLGMTQTIELSLPPGRLTVRRESGPPARVPPVWELAVGPDGRAGLGPFAAPGLWQIARDGGEVLGHVCVLWADESEQALPFVAHARADFGALNPARVLDWRDLLPGLLLYLVLGLVLLEWLLWLGGVTE
jgi:hypothetical protein